MLLHDLPIQTAMLMTEQKRFSRFGDQQFDVTSRIHGQITG